MIKRVILFSGLIFSLSLQCLFAQRTDTVSLTLGAAEKLFLQNSFQALAAKYEVDQADAAIIQAKLWPNPTLNIDQGAYNPNTKKWFDVTSTGETAISIQQEIHLAAQRNKNVRVEKITADIARSQFAEVMRGLHFQLRSAFFNLYTDRQSLAIYDLELTSLQSLLTAYNALYQNGNVPFKEVVRLQALQFSLQSERIDLLKDAAENQSNLVLLTSDTLGRPIKPIMEGDDIGLIKTDNLTFIQLLDSSYANRHDLIMANQQLLLNNANLSLQKALAVPDLYLGANYDRSGSYIENYNSLTLSIDLPLFNRNQGNIKAAKFKLEESDLQKGQAELVVKTDVEQAYAQLLETSNLYKGTVQKLNTDYDKLFTGIVQGYKERAIGLLEFLDYYEDYKDSKLAYYKLQNDLLQAAENLNYVTGKNWFNY
jgi:cobalt-zinc-cadmium efflux system outer membrane protein